MQVQCEEISKKNPKFYTNKLFFGVCFPNENYSVLVVGWDGLGWDIHNRSNSVLLKGSIVWKTVFGYL